MNKYISWVVRGWPVLSIFPLFITHMLLIYLPCLSSQFLCWSNTQINVLISLLLQILGGILVIYSIDSNIGLFKNKNLISLAFDWAKESPWSKPKAQNIYASGIPSASAVGTPTVDMEEHPSTTEEHLLYLQKQIDSLKDELSTTKSELNNNIKDIKGEISSNHIDNTQTQKDLHKRLETISIGGLKTQTFGVLLMIYGSVAAYLT